MAYLNTLYFVDINNKKLHQFDKDALVTDGYPLVTDKDPYNVLVCTNTHDIWVTNQSSNTVYKYTDGKFVQAINVAKQPRGICEGRNGEIYVTCYGSNYVCKIEKDTTTNGYKVTKISVGRAPTAVCVNHNGELYVTLFTSKKIVKVINNTVVATLNTGMYPTSICCDKSDNIWVANRLSNTVQKFSKDLENPIATIKVSKAPVSICCGYNGSIYVACMTSDAVCRIDGNKLAATYITSTKPTSISSTENAIYVLCDGDSGSAINKIDSNTDEKATIIEDDLKYGKESIQVRGMGGDCTGYQSYLVLKYQNKGAGLTTKIGFDDLNDALKEMIQKGSTSDEPEITLPIADINISHPDTKYSTVKAALDYLLTKPDPTFEVNKAKGGHHTVDTLEDMYAIPADLRVIGMECYVVEESKTYTLLIDNGDEKTEKTDWIENTVGAKGVLYEDGTNVADKIDQVEKKANTKYLYFILQPVGADEYATELIVPFDGEIVSACANTDVGKTLATDLTVEVQMIEPEGTDWAVADTLTIPAGSTTNMVSSELAAAITVSKLTRLRCVIKSVDNSADLRSVQVTVGINQTVDIKTDSDDTETETDGE